MLHIFSPARKSTYETKRKNYAMLLRSKLKISKIEDYKNLRLLKLKITKILHNCNSSTKHSCNTVQRTQITTAIAALLSLTKLLTRWRGFCLRRSRGLQQSVTWSGKRLALPKLNGLIRQKLTLQFRYNKLFCISMLKISSNNS